MLLVYMYCFCPELSSTSILCMHERENFNETWTDIYEAELNMFALISACMSIFLIFFIFSHIGRKFAELNQR